MRISKIAAMAVAIVASTASYAAGGFKTLEVNGVRVIDGDTVEVLPIKGQSERVRLLGIDAPESKQAFGQASKQSLQQCVAGKKVKIQYQERDKYSRLLGKVVANGVDCNLYQVKSGMAHHYKHFQNQQPPADRSTYNLAEKLAKQKRLGLWADPNPVDPYKFRQSNK